MDTQVILRAVLVLLLAMPAGMAQGGAVPGVAEDDSAFVIHSSRNLIGEKKLEWVTEMRNKLPMASRKIGPFGMSQDPNVQVAQKANTKAKPGAFLNAIKAIKVNAVVPSEKKFIIGSREFHAGDAFPVIRGQRQFNLKIVSVRSDHIIFKNVDTGEHVRRNLNALPPGVRRDSSILSVPGVIPANKKDDSPLHLGSPTLPASTN